MTEDCRSHLLTQTIKGILMFWESTPSGRGISISYSPALGYPKYFLCKMLLTSIFRFRRIRATYTIYSIWLLNSWSITVLSHLIQIHNAEICPSLELFQKIYPIIELFHESPRSGEIEHNDDDGFLENLRFLKLGEDFVVESIFDHVCFKLAMSP